MHQDQIAAPASVSFHGNIPIVKQEELMESNPSGVERARIRVIGGKFQTVIFFYQGKGNLVRVSEGWREVWRHVTMVALFLDDNKPNDEGNGKENGKKYYVYINQQQLCTCIMLLCKVFLPSLQHYDMKLPNFTSALYWIGEHDTKIVAFSF